MAALKVFSLLAIAFCVAQNAAASPVGEEIQTLSIETDPYRCIFLVHEVYGHSDQIRSLYTEYKDVVFSDKQTKNDCYSKYTGTQLTQCLENNAQNSSAKMRNLVAKLKPVLLPLATLITDVHNCLFEN